jgi:protein-disulfide isomerase
MFAIGRRKLILGASALALAGCGNSGGASVTVTPDDMVIGAANAPLTLVEYGSAMCGHCRAFEEATWDTLKREYIDTGKVRFVFREAFAPVSQDGSGTLESITLAMYQVSRCNGATAEQYFTRLGVFFEQQPAIFEAGTIPAIREKILEIGGAAGLADDQMDACISDAAGAARLQRLGESFSRDAQAAGQQGGTPMFFLDGAYTPTDNLMGAENLRRTLDAAAAGS